MVLYGRNKKQRKNDVFSQRSYIAANTFPIKILKNIEFLNHLSKTGKIPPVHIQLNPTNRCNMNCSYCSCSNRNKNIEMTYEKIMEIMKKAKKLGCQSVTITGGGEPLMHPKINEIIIGLVEMGIECGLVVNGFLLDKLWDETIKKTTWVRISSDDFKSIKFLEPVKRAVERGKSDWAFSHVISNKPNWKTLKAIIEFANEYKFTHVRLVSDLLNLNAIADMNFIKDKLKKMWINDEKVIYQGRKKYRKGSKKCLISLLKPVITADGWITPCCGVQYALKNPSRDYEPSMRMCRAEDIEKMYVQQKYFDGSVCVRCYYTNYNNILTILLKKFAHIKFV